MTHCDWLSGSSLIKTEMIFLPYFSLFHLFTVDFKKRWYSTHVFSQPSLARNFSTCCSQKCISKFVLHKPKGSLKIVGSVGCILGINHISGSFHPLAYRKGSQDRVIRKITHLTLSIFLQMQLPKNVFLKPHRIDSIKCVNFKKKKKMENTRETVLPEFSKICLELHVYHRQGLNGCCTQTLF